MANRSQPSDRQENLVLALAEQFAGVPTVESYPISLMLDPSSICHLKCPACISSRPDQVRTRTLMRFEMFKSIIDELGPYLFELDLYNWGESLLNPELPAMLAYARRFPAEILISTNLSLALSDTLAQALVDHVDRVFVSLDGLTQETYSKYRVGGSRDLVMANLRKLVELREARRRDLPLIEWQFLVFAFNEHELKPAEAMADALGVKFRPIAPYLPKGHGDWLSSLPEYHGAQTANPAGAETPERIPDRVWRLAHSRPNRCDWHYLRAAINANGSVSPCCAIQEESRDFGSVQTDSFHRVWNNSLFQSARRYFSASLPAGAGQSDPPACFTCKWPGEQHHCHGLLTKIFEDMRQAEPQVKAGIREVLPSNIRQMLPPEPLPVRPAPRDGSPVLPRIVRRLLAACGIQDSIGKNSGDSGQGG